MAEARKTDVNASSMIDLKAELFRKQEEFKQLKALRNADFVKGRKAEKHDKPDIWSKKNAGVLQRAQVDYEQRKEEENIFENSRKALEAKSKIYDQIASSSEIPDEDGSDGYLVDFQKKVINKIVEDRRKDTSNHGDENDDIDEPVSSPSNPDEEWVDYVDSFGRSRRCMTKDLPFLEKQERLLGSSNDMVLKLKGEEVPSLLSEDMRKELRRQKWEKEAQEALKGPIHYANVQFDEIRSHGVGYYQFSKDSNLREEQMEALNKLREKTMEERMRSERIKNKRKVMLEARLAKVKQRRKLKGGTLLGLEDNEDAEKTTEPVTKEDKKTEPELLTRDDNWRHTAPVREWDKGKERMTEWNATRYFEDKRNERMEEFAPPQFYFHSQQQRTSAHLKPAHKATVTRPHFHNSTGLQTSLPVNSKCDTLATEGSTKAMLQHIRSFTAPSSFIHDSPLKNAEQDRSTETDDLRVSVESGVERTESNPVSFPVPIKAFVSDDINPTMQSDMLNSNKSVTAQSSMAQIDACADVTQEFAGSLSKLPLPSIVEASSFTPQPYNWQTLPEFHPPSFSYQPNLHLQAHQQVVPNLAPVLTPSFSAGHLESLKNAMPDVPSAHTQVSLSSAANQSTPLASQFVYPSQHGLLSDQQVLKPPSNPDSNLHTAFSKTSSSKANLVDKRFMQNREASDADLLGCNIDDSEALLMQVKPVSYRPGFFSASSSNSDAAKGTANLSRKSTPVHYEDKSPIDSSISPGSANKFSTTDMKTNVIFGLPDFLHPATGIETQAYQPGSFMAAKQAAAQRAEEAYEEARRKTHYSSAPVLYKLPPIDKEEVSDAKVKVADETPKMGDESSKSFLSGRQDEVENLLKNIRGGL